MTERTGLTYELEFASSPQDDDGHAWGRGRFWLNDVLVWAQDGEDGSLAPLTWTWIELLEHLAAAWSSLRCEETYPFGLTPATPNELRFAAERRWKERAPIDRVREDEELFLFEDRHDLARGLRGVALPPLFVMREGRQMWICSTDVLCQRPLDDVLGRLAEIGDRIAKQVSASANPRAVTARSAWERRESLTDFVAVRTGLPTALLEALRGQQSADEFWEVDTANDDSELLAAARMIGGRMPREEMAKMLDAVRAEPHRQTPDLDALSHRAENLVDANEQPYQDGYELAVWLRQELSLGAGRVDPRAMLQAWGVNIVEMTLERTPVEALACWGPRHGPTVILNLVDLQGDRLTPERIRASLAHEICHLLVDRQASLPMAEVLRGIAPRRPEQRARAFAAELLLPKAATAAMLRTARDVATALRQLRTVFAVSARLAAWQMLNADDRPPLSLDEKRYLEAVAEDRRG